MSQYIDLDSVNSTPIWRQIADALTAGISAGTWQPGTAIPSETELSRQSGIARGTARKAVQSLIDKGLVFAVQGKGTYVATGSPDEQQVRAALDVADADVTAN